MLRPLRVFLCVVAVAVPASASAQTAPEPGSEAATTTEAPETAPTADEAEAKEHFQRAKELYLAGSYREAITELEAARALDPDAKDLVFNLGVVNEKLANYDEAIANFRAYVEMEGVTDEERARAEKAITRNEGAKREAAEAAARAQKPAPQTPAPERPAPAPARGRIDALTISAASLAVVGLGVGTFFGVKALSTRPNDFVTGRDGSYADLVSKTDDAHTQAIIADVGFGVGVLSALAAAYLYFGRTKEASSRSASVQLAPAFVRGGGAMLVGGSFR